jgi:hypothetical protein
MGDCVYPTDSPTTATLTANTSMLQAGQTAYLTIRGQDQNGVDKVCYSESQNGLAQCYTCSGSGSQSCSNTWAITKNQADSYVFFGYVYGKQPGTSQTKMVLTSPAYLYISFSAASNTNTNTNTNYDECVYGAKKCQV